MQPDSERDKTLVSIYRPANPPQASILRSLLQNNGIHVHVDGSDMEMATGELPMGFATAPHIRVFKKDEGDARAIIEDFENGKYAEVTEGWQGVDYADGGFDWPECPRCSELRYAVCPECEFAGIDFEAEAIYEVSLDAQGEMTDHTPQPHLLKCPICSTKSTPQFTDICWSCKFTNTDDISTTTDEFSLPEYSNVNWPVILTGVVVGAILLIGLVYFLAM